MKRKKAAYVDDLQQRLKDPGYAAEYLNAVLEDDEEGADAVFLLALRNVAEAFQMSSVAEHAGVNRENLYRMLSHNGNPKLSSLLAVLKAVGLHLSVEATDIPGGGTRRRNREGLGVTGSRTPTTWTTRQRP